MNFRKILLILGIVVFASVFVMNASFGASSEKITKYEEHKWDNHDKKIVSIDRYTVNTKKSNSFYVNTFSSYDIKIKKPYMNKYKIKSVNVKFAVYEKGAYDFKEYIYKNYTVKNKNSLKLKDTNMYVDIEKITINYFTKSKIKNETTAFLNPRGKWKSIIYFYGEKSTGKLSQKGYMKKGYYGCDGTLTYSYFSTYNDFKVYTTNTKYKIDKVKLIFYGHAETFEGTKTYNAYGKNSITIKSFGSYGDSWMGDYKVYYH